MICASALQRPGSAAIYLDDVGKALRIGHHGLVTEVNDVLARRFQAVNAVNKPGVRPVPVVPKGTSKNKCMDPSELSGSVRKVLAPQDGGIGTVCNATKALAECVPVLERRSVQRCAA